MSGRRTALIIANDVYEHAGLRALRSPSADAAALAEVLSDRRISDFDVHVVRDETAHAVLGRIEDLFSDARPDDVLLLHFSCHGLKSESGELHFAMRDTRPDRLRSTAVSADYVQRCMATSRSRSIVLLLDCCYGGAYRQGVAVRAAGDAHVFDSFAGGRGRAVITASSAMEYAFEGDHLTDDQPPRPSVFTAAVVEGLATGAADRDADGLIGLGELYDYVFEKVRDRNPHQTPSRDVEMQGELYLARSDRKRVTDVTGLDEVRNRLASGDLREAYDLLARLANADQAVVEAPVVVEPRTPAPKAATPVAGALAIVSALVMTLGAFLGSSYEETIQQDLPFGLWYFSAMIVSAFGGGALLLGTSRKPLPATGFLAGLAITATWGVALIGASLAKGDSSPAYPGMWVVSAGLVLLMGASGLAVGSVGRAGLVGLSRRRADGLAVVTVLVAVLGVALLSAWVGHVQEGFGFAITVVPAAIALVAQIGALFLAPRRFAFAVVLGWAVGTLFLGFSLWDLATELHTNRSDLVPFLCSLPIALALAVLRSRPTS